MARSFSRSFYDSHEWEQVRAYVLMRDRYTCQRCGKPAQEVHHIIHLTPDNIWDVNISLNPNNLISLCRADHFLIHSEDKKEGKRKARGHQNNGCADGFHFDEAGQVVPDTIERPPGAAD